MDMMTCTKYTIRWQVGKGSSYLIKLVKNDLGRGLINGNINNIPWLFPSTKEG